MFRSLIITNELGGGPDAAARLAVVLAGRSRLSVESISVEPGEDVARAIVEHVRHRDGALLVIATGATTLVSGERRSVTADVLAELPRPVLVLGPAAGGNVALRDPTLVVALDHSRDTNPALPVADSWLATFGGGQPRVVHVVAPAAWPPGSIAEPDERRDADAAVARLAEHGVDAVATVVRSDDPVGALLAAGDAVPDPVFVVTSDRWAPGTSHWYAAARRLIQRSARPVLLVPADLPGW